MQQVGVITEVHNNKAIIQIKRATACGGECHKCSGCETTLQKVEARNGIEAKVGQTVQLEMKDSTILFAAFLVYIIPLVMLFIGYGAGSALFADDLIGGFCGVLFMGMSFWVLKRKDKKLHQSQKYELVITKIIG
ncbi:MAG: SoxR reducing system RseC family protein [Firmicutes bacterium]|nr:SoxR reducing system RseC family protein [Bacillota bacterium]